MTRENKLIAVLCFSSVAFIIIMVWVDAYYIKPNVVEISYANVTIKDKALYEHCLVETELKYPIAAPDIIERLCELEQIGRNMA